VEVGVEEEAFGERELGRIVFPPEPPVAMEGGHNGAEAVKGAPEFGAAKRTLAGEHRVAKRRGINGRRRGNTIVIPAGGL
jgi:hypothetical protein